MDNSKSVRILPTEEYFALVRQMLCKTGCANVRVTGMSMWPLLHHLRDSVVISKPDHIRFGDIVLFDRRNGRYALHRVISRRKDGFDMAGDHQWHFEINLPYDQIVGVVTSINRNGRSISCSRLSMKIYAVTVAFTAKPRIYLQEGICKVLRTLRFSGSQSRKE